MNLVYKMYILILVLPINALYYGYDLIYQVPINNGRNTLVTSRIFPSQQSDKAQQYYNDVMSITKKLEQPSEIKNIIALENIIDSYPSKRIVTIRPYYKRFYQRQWFWKTTTAVSIGLLVVSNCRRFL